MVAEPLLLELHHCPNGISLEISELRVSYSSLIEKNERRKNQKQNKYTFRISPSHVRTKLKK